jgi:hypothetical protein
MLVVTQMLGGRERAMIEYMPALGAGLLTISIVVLDLYFRFRWRWHLRQHSGRR